MPNWCYSTIHFQNKKDLKRVVDQYVDNNEDFLFDKIVPMPESLKHTTSPVGNGSMAYALLENEHDTDEEIMERLTSISNELNTEIDKLFWTPSLFQEMRDEWARPNELKRLFGFIHDPYTPPGKKPAKRPAYYDSMEAYALNMVKNQLQYQAIDWYSWSCDNWGTKWSGIVDDIDFERHTLFVRTAWAPPLPIFQKLSEKEQLIIYVEYAEEQFSAYAGEILLNKGNVDDFAEYTDDTDFNLFCIASRSFDPEQECYRYLDNGEQPPKIYYDWQVDHEDDPDDEEKYGITKEFFDAIDVHVLTTDMYQKFIDI